MQKSLSQFFSFHVPNENYALFTVPTSFNRICVIPRSLLLCYTLSLSYTLLFIVKENCASPKEAHQQFHSQGLTWQSQAAPTAQGPREALVRWSSLAPSAATDHSPNVSIISPLLHSPTGKGSLLPQTGNMINTHGKHLLPTFQSCTVVISQPMNPLLNEQSP